jgi:hypothetical protein
MIKNKNNLTFEINNSTDLFNKLIDEYNDFDKQHLNPRFALNCAITTWHLSDWSFNEFFKNDPRFQDSEINDKKGCVKKISGLLKYQNHIKKECQDLEYMRLITNGIKHCVLNDKSRKESSKIKQGDYSTEYSRHDYDVSRFIIELDSKNEIDFEKALLSTINYWKKILKVELKQQHTTINKAKRAVNSKLKL